MAESDAQLDEKMRHARENTKRSRPRATSDGSLVEKSVVANTAPSNAQLDSAGDGMWGKQRDFAPSDAALIFNFEETEDAYADVDDEDEDGNTTLHLAAGCGDIPSINMLLKRGAKVESRNHEDQTALFVSSCHGQAGSLRRLAEAGASVEAAMHGGWRPLHAAARNNHPQCVDALLAAGARIDALSEDGSTALWVAARWNCAAAAARLVKAGADARVATGGLTPLEAAKKHGSSDVEALLRAGAAVRSKNAAPHGVKPSNCDEVFNLYSDMISFYGKYSQRQAFPPRCNNKLDHKKSIPRRPWDSDDYSDLGSFSDACLRSDDCSGSRRTAYSSWCPVFPTISYDFICGDRQQESSLQECEHSILERCTSV